MNILFVTPYYKPYLGSIERCIEQLSINLQKLDQNIKIGVLTTHFAFPRVYNPALKDYEIDKDNVKIFRIRSFPNFFIPYYTVPLVYYSIIGIKKVLQEFKPDIIQWVGDGWFYGHMLTQILKSKNSKIIFTPSFHPHFISQYPWLKPFNKYLTAKADKVVALSSFESNLLKSNYYMNTQKNEIIPWGIGMEVETKNSIKENLIINVLNVGRFGKHKNQKQLLKIWSKSYPQFNFKARLQLVGDDENDGEGYDFLSNYAKELNISDSVEISNNVNDEMLGNFYAKSDIYIQFSKYEAFGLVFLEAMNKGLATMTHDVGPIKEILQDGAVIVPPGDENTAIKELVKLVNNQKYRNLMQTKGQEQATKYSWKNTAQKYLKLYKSIKVI